jgi:hypothetical protein
MMFLVGRTWLLKSAVHLPIPNFITATLSIFISRALQPGEIEIFQRLAD